MPIDKYPNLSFKDTKILSNNHYFFVFLHMNFSARSLALAALNKHYKIKKSSLYLYNNTGSNISQFEKALANEIKNGVVRWQMHLDYFLESLLQNGIKNTDPEIINILRMGMYQILFMDKIPDYATINELVELTKHVKNTKISNLTNAILREFLRKKNSLKYPEEFNKYLSVYYSHPIWLVNHWVSIFGKSQTQELLQANNSRPNISIRINKLKSNLKEILPHFQNSDVFLKTHDDNIILLKKIGENLEKNSFFIDGKITIQDLSAALCARLASPKHNDFVIDLCAAPGGKTCLLAELMNNTGKIISNDISVKKINLIKENLLRLNIYNTETNICDALDFPNSNNSDFYNNKADLVLLDAPCSGFGTIRKLPEIKYNRTWQDVSKLITMQRKLLIKAANLVKTGGVLVYSTCSIEPDENIDNIKWFLDNNNQFFLEPADNYIEKKYCKDNYLQTFPHVHNIDGAFAARLIKKNNFFYF